MKVTIDRTVKVANGSEVRTFEPGDHDLPEAWGRKLKPFASAKKKAVKKAAPAPKPPPDLPKPPSDEV